MKYSHDEIVARMRDCQDDLERLAKREKAGELTETDEQRWIEQRDTFDELNEERKRLEREADLARIARVASNPSAHVRGSTDAGMSDPFGDGPDSVEDRAGVFSNPWRLDGVNTFGRSSEQVGGELRARALSAIEQAPAASNAVRERMTAMIEDADTVDGKLARQLLVSSSPDYVRAFTKVMTGRQHTLTEVEQRAMSLTDAAGGYLVPFQLDPSVIITADGSVNEIRRVARTVMATGDVWNGVSAGSVDWSWDGEAVEVSDDAPTFAQPTIANHKLQAWVPISLEALADAANVTQAVAELLAFGKDEKEAAAFALGTGSGEPTGIITALTGTSSELSSDTADVFALSDVYKLDDNLPARYRRRAAWLANRATYNAVRQFDTAGGAGLWERVGAGQPNELIGRPALESEDMDGTVDAAADNRILVFGDFSNYVITDRVGTTVEMVQTVFGANQRPTGQRGWHAYFRTGADSVNDGAFRMLNC